MQIIDLNPKYKEKYIGCLYDKPEDWKDWQGGLEGKRTWYQKMQERGLRVKLALNDEGEACGMIQYGPSENCFTSVKNMFFIYCIWIPKKPGKENMRRRGMGKALLQAAEEDVRARGADAIMAWGVSLPFWMKASYYKKHGYQKLDKDGMAVLLWKPFSEKAHPPRWERPKKKPELMPDKVVIDVFNSGWCTLQCGHAALVKQVAAELGDQVLYRDVDTSDPARLEEWGISDTIYVNGKELIKGPPMDLKKIRKKIGKQMRKLRQAR